MPSIVLRITIRQQHTQILSMLQVLDDSMSNQHSATKEFLHHTCHKSNVAIIENEFASSTVQSRSPKSRLPNPGRQVQITKSRSPSHQVQVAKCRSSSLCRQVLGWLLNIGS